MSGFSNSAFKFLFGNVRVAIAFDRFFGVGVRGDRLRFSFLVFFMGFNKKIIFIFKIVVKGVGFGGVGSDGG